MGTFGLDYVALGKRIRAKRKSKRLTQEKLAELANISLPFLGHIERGSRKASIETLLSIATALDTTPDVLLRDSLVDTTSNTDTDEVVRRIINQRLGSAEARQRSDASPEMNELISGFDWILVSVVMGAYKYGALCGEGGVPTI